MATRRCLQALSRRATALLASSPSIQSLEVVALHSSCSSGDALLKSHSHRWIFANLYPCLHRSQVRLFSSGSRDDDDSDSEVEDEDEDEDGEMEEGSESETDCVGHSKSIPKKEYTAEEKEAEAAEIGYKVIGQLQRSDRVFKDYEPVFAVVQIGSHQFKVSNGDCIFTERLKFCDVNDKVILNKILLLGSKTQTIIGRPILPDAAVHAIVEEHALDAKVIIFKKKRRKKYRRTNGHRQELTKLRITNIEGIEKPVTEMPVKAASVKKPEKVAVAS